MAFSEKIRLIVDVTTGNASSQLSRLRTDLGNAEGGFAKMQVAGASAGNFLKQNMGMAVAAAGTAIAAFGIRAVEDFQAVALGAGRLRDSLGITADEASRFQEVAGDMGISVQALESGIGRMNRAVADTPGAFDDIGAAIARSADGTVNVTETFKNAAEALKRIPNATDRAAAAQKIFGRGWQQMSELIMSGSEGITEAMAGVEAGKIVGDDQINDARKFRDALDALKGNVEELSVALGGQLVPVLADAAETLQEVIDLANQMPELPEWMQDVRDKVEDFPLLPHQQIAAGVGMVTDKVGDLRDALGAAVNGSAEGMVDLAAGAENVATAFEQAGSLIEGWLPRGPAIEEATEDIRDWIGWVEESTTAVDDAADAHDRLDQALYEVTSQWEELTGALNDNEAFRNVERSFESVHEAAVAAWDATAAGTEDATALARDHASEVDAMKIEVIDYAREVANISPQQTTDILALIDQGKYAEALAKLRALEQARSTTLTVRVQATGDTGYFSAAPGNKIIQRATALGGSLQAGEASIVNEHGPNGSEVFVPKVPGQVLSRASAERSYREGVAMANGGGSNTYNITINGAGPDGGVEAWRRELWRRGAVPR